MSTVVSQEETIQLIKDVKRAFQAREETALIEQMEQSKKKIKEIFENKQQEYEKLIQAMQLRVSKAKEEATRKISEQEYRAEVEAVELEENHILSNIRQYQEELESLAAQKLEAETEVGLLKQELETVKLEHKQSLPKTRYALSLYVNITNIEWDYAEQNLVKGRVLLDNDIRSFSLDPSKHSQVILTNYLWDLIEEK